VNPAVSLFKFFASLKLAIFLLLALALVFAAGTFIESAYGTEAAQLVVYQSFWMSLLLILLALNVAAAALDRLPWKTKHVGFVITHAGIILILAGSLVTRAYGVEGQIAVQEGETAGRMILSDALLHLFSEDSNVPRSLPLPKRAFSWEGREVLDSNLALLRYYPKASRQEKIEASSNGPAGLRVILQSSFMKVEEWLILDDPQRQRINLGPAELRFSREKISSPKESGGGGFLEFQLESSLIQLPVEENVSKTLPLKGTPYRVTLLRILKDAVVEKGELVDRSEAWNNPACELILEGKGIREKHTVFSKYPDFPTLHGLKPGPAGIRIFYHRPEEGDETKNELRFVWQEGQTPFYQVRKGGGVSEGPVRLGEEYQTGWMDFKFRVEDYFPHTRLISRFHEEPVSSQAEEYLSAVEIELSRQGEKKSFWLGQGDTQSAALGGRTFQIIYGMKTKPLGFRITLKDFRVENYPGTGRPAGFESDVTVKDDSTGTVREVNIRMNQPLRYRGYKVFQSGYQQPEGEPEISIFTVAKDPGIPVKYGGAFVLIGGILTMFYTRRFSTREDHQLIVLKKGTGLC